MVLLKGGDGRVRLPDPPDADGTLSVGIDIGGTFTDVAMLNGRGEVFASKAATTPDDPARGVFDALEGAAAQVGTDVTGLLARSDRITHGSTVATNALLTRTGARVGLITTRGFEDTPFIMRAIGRVDGLPEELVRHVAWLTKPEPLVNRSLVRGVTERIDARGQVIVPLRGEDVERALDELLDKEHIESLAVCLLNAWANPVHEQRVRSMVETSARGIDLYCAYSHQLARVAGEYARVNTTLLDAFVGPAVRQYLQNLENELRRRSFRGHFLLMQGNGGLAGLKECSAVATLQSGPAGGMLAAAHMAGVLGHSRVLTADMGGTSFDVGVCVDGYWRYAQEPIVDRFRILQPIIDVESIGAGGGTIARAEEPTGRLLVGPQSAGGRPGPACYGLGGADATVTDADVALGIIDPDYFLGGSRKLDRQRAEAVLDERVARPLGLEVLEAAAGIQAIVDGKMADLVRQQVIRSHGLPEDFVLYAFGGAAPAHAVAFARQLGIRRIHVFPTSPVFSAFGIALADVRHTRVMSCQLPLPTDPRLLNEPFAELSSSLLEVMRREGFSSHDVRLHRYATLQFRRQAVGVELEIPWEAFDSERVGALIDLFARKYEGLYGVGAGNVAAGVEVNALRVDAVGAVSKPALHASAAAGHDRPVPKGHREVFVEGSVRQTPIYEWAALRTGQTVGGPAVIEARFTTVMVPGDASAHLDGYGNLVLSVGEREEGGAR
jgi:N-methylhydantoinase A